MSKYYAGQTAGVRLHPDISLKARRIAVNIAKLPGLLRKVKFPHFATSSGGNGEGFSVRIPFIELRVGVGGKGDHRRKAGAAFRAEPNVTRVLVAPILGPDGRNQLSIAVNTTHHVKPLD